MRDFIRCKPVLPAYIGDRELNVSNVTDHIRADRTGIRITPPDWIADLIFIQANICKVTPEGTFASALPVLDHLAETGVNALWLTPFFENSGNVNRTSHYGNQGPHTLAADCFRAADRVGREEELRLFVRRAHERGIYVFADVVTYGVLASGELYQSYQAGVPFEGMDVSDWFTGEPLYSGYRFRWESRSLRDWFTGQMTDLIMRYGLDGFRVDSEPSYLWYDSDGDGIADRYADLFTDVRLRIAGYIRQPDGLYCYPADGHGREIAVFSEKNNLRTFGYDFEQYGVIHYGRETVLSFQLRNGAHHNWFSETDLAESVRSGQIASGSWFTERLHAPVDLVNRFRYYTYCISNHDYHSTAVNRRLWVAGYQAILAPFLPIWYYGEECGLISTENIWLNAVPVCAECLLENAENAAFYEQFRKLIAIRRCYPDLFAISAPDIRESNVAPVTVSEGGLAYARRSRKRLALVLANPGSESLCCGVSFSKSLLPPGEEPCFRELLGGGMYRAEDAAGDCLSVRDISIAPDGMAVLLAGDDVETAPGTVL